MVFSGREAYPGFSPEKYIKQKIRWKTIGPFVVPPQVVPNMRCVQGLPDFWNMVWSWSSKNVVF